MSNGCILTPSGPMPVKQFYTLTGGKAYPVDKAYTLTGGKAQLWYQRSTLLGSLAVGNIVKIRVNGADKDFIIVHQGLPSSVYDNSCNGTWLLMKDIYTTMKWGSSNHNSYKGSNVTTYLNETFLSLIDTDICNAIKQIKIPYTNGTGSGGSLATGANGFSTKVFLLSGAEVGFSGVSYMNTEGAKLSYFDSASKRVAYNGSSAAGWWLRSPYTSGGSYVWFVESDGSSARNGYNYTYGVRPALILPQNVLVDDTEHIVA